MSQKIRKILGTGVILMSLATPNLLHAQETEAPRLLVQSPAFQGKWTDRAEQALYERIVDAVQRAEVVAIDLDGRLECDQGNCLMANDGDPSFRFVLESAIQKKSRDYEFAFRLFDAERNLLAETGGRCEICGEEEVSQMLGGKLTAMLLRAREQEEAPAEISIGSQPKGAEVLLDGQPVGHTPLVLQVSSGSHQIQLSKEGFGTVRRVVEGSPGVQRFYDLTMEKNDVGQKKIKTETLVRLGGASVGLGIIGMASGIALIAFDRQEYRGRCSGKDVDSQGDCHYLLNTRWGGVAAVVSGVALLSLGSVSLLTAKRRRKANFELRASISPTKIGLKGKF